MDKNWRQLTVDSPDSDILLYYDIGAGFFFEDDYYLKWNSPEGIDYLRRQMRMKEKDKIEHWIYENEDKKAVFGIRHHSAKRNPYTKEIGMWRIHDACYKGTWADLHDEGWSWEGLRFIVKVVRQRLDEKGIQYVYCHLNGKDKPKEYSPKFFKTMQKCLWEITEIWTRPDGHHYIWHINRDEEKKPANEENWISDRLISTKPDTQMEDL